jgi:hypothetical protein
MSEHPPRRRFQFGLKGLFIAVTVVAIPLAWLAWQREIVRHRLAMREYLRSRNSLVDCGQPFSWPTHGDAKEVRPGDPSYRVSAIRRFFGDITVNSIIVNRQLDPEDERAVAAFPEAAITAVPASP